MTSVQRRLALPESVSVAIAEIDADMQEFWNSRERTPSRSRWAPQPQTSHASVDFYERARD